MDLIKPRGCPAKTVGEKKVQVSVYLSSSILVQLKNIKICKRLYTGKTWFRRIYRAKWPAGPNWLCTHKSSQHTR